MTDQRVSDLPYGQVGDCTYDIEQQRWTFARQISYNYGIQPVNLSKQCLPPTLPHYSSTPAPSRKVQKTVLTKRFPELLPAAFITAELEKAAPDEASSTKELLSTSSSLIGIGKAVDIGNRAGARIDVIAVASGQAGDVLRLIRPHIVKLAWPEHGGIHIETLDPGTAIQDCYWAGTGGPIRQITFATEQDSRSRWLTSSSTWLAVRQLTSTTIFRPIHRKELSPAILPAGSPLKYPPSRLTSNPLVTIPISDTGGLPHADVAFNPFYVRQVAILDQGGSWSIWDIEGSNRKSTLKIGHIKNGHMFDDFKSEATSGQPDLADGWGRILFAGDVTTLVVCGRCHFAAFNIQAEPTRLQTPDVFTSMSSGWILDVKRNPRQLSHLFVLTSARVFWLEVVPDDGKIIVLYSCRHFRDEDGENMRLDVLSEESFCTLLLYSGANALINTYRLSTENGMPESMDSSFVCKTTAGKEATEPCTRMHSISVIASGYGGRDVQNGDSSTGPGAKYLENDILFYQMFTLNVDLELRSTICSTTFPLGRDPTRGSFKYEVITAPSVKEKDCGPKQYRLPILADPFIVPDEFENDSDMEDMHRSIHPQGYRSRRHIGTSQRPPYTVDYHQVFERALLDETVEEIHDEESPETQSEDILEFLQSLPRQIEDWKDDENALFTTLLEFTNSLSFSGDIDDVAATLSDVLQNLSPPEDGDNETGKILTVSDLNGADLSLLTGSSPDFRSFPLMAVYNHLISVWITKLPRRTPGSVRLTKERLIRKVATDLALSSVGVSMRSPPEQKPDENSYPDAMDLDRGTPFSSSQLEPIAESSQRSQRTRSRSFSMDPGLLTPTYTASLISEGPTATAGDPAISLLRTYLDLPSGVTSSPMHWVNGLDPSFYSWEAIRQAEALAEDEDDDDASTKRERQKRKKRQAEKMARYQRSGTGESASQPPSIAHSRPPSIAHSQPPFSVPSSSYLPSFGSQPAGTQNAAGSSQVRVDVPMTQPVDGRFGGRQAVKKRKGKKRKQGF